MKKYIGVLSVIVNCMLITGLLVHAFTLDSVKDSENDNKKEYVYIEKTTTVKEEKEIDPEERKQEDITKNSKVNDSKNYTNNTHNYVEKTTTTKTTCCNDGRNNSNDNKNYSNDIKSNSNTNNNNNSNSNENDISNNNYTVEYTNTSYCGFCGKQLNNNDGICETCKDIRSKLGE